MRAAASRDVRRHNLSLVLGEVVRSPSSRTALAGETGLNKSTVSSLVAELCDLGFLRDSGQERSGAVGRPPQNVELDPEGPFVLGLEINVDYLALWATDLGGAVLHRNFTASDNREAPESVAVRLELLAREALAEPFARGRGPVASAVAVPGIVGHTGEIVVAPNLYWENVPLATMLSDELGPLSVENEANLGALAELSEGAGREFADFVYLSAEVGIGAGIVLDGELFRGAHGFGGEIGHLTIDPSGPPCSCGSRGCLERLAGQDALLRLVGWDARTGGPGPRPEWPGAMLAESARAGQPKTLEALRQVGHTLGIAAAAVVNLLNPQALLLGGYFAPLTPWLREPIEAELHRRLLAGAWWPTRSPTRPGRWRARPADTTTRWKPSSSRSEPSAGVAPPRRGEGVPAPGRRASGSSGLHPLMAGEPRTNGRICPPRSAPGRRRRAAQSL